MKAVTAYLAGLVTGVVLCLTGVIPPQPVLAQQAPSAAVEWVYPASPVEKPYQARVTWVLPAQPVELICVSKGSTTLACLRPDEDVAVRTPYPPIDQAYRPYAGDTFTVTFNLVSGGQLRATAVLGPAYLPVRYLPTVFRQV